MIGRRGFLRSLLSAAVASATLDPEKLLWIPGQRTYFDVVNPRGNALLTPEWITREMFQVLQNNLAFASTVNRQYAGVAQMAEQGFRKAQVAGSMPAIGPTFNIRLPKRFSLS